MIMALLKNKNCRFYLLIFLDKSNALKNSYIGKLDYE